MTIPHIALLFLYRNEHQANFESQNDENLFQWCDVYCIALNEWNQDAQDSISCKNKF